MLEPLPLLAFVVLTGACSKQEDKPAAQPYTEAKALALMAKLGNTYEAAGTNCDKLVADLAKLVADNKAEMIEQSAWKATLSPDEKAAFENKLATEVEIGKKMLDGVKACGDQPRYQAALAELDKVLE